MMYAYLAFVYLGRFHNSELHRHSHDDMAAVQGSSFPQTLLPAPLLYIWLFNKKKPQAKRLWLAGFKTSNIEVWE